MTTTAVQPPFAVSNSNLGHVVASYGGPTVQAKAWIGLGVVFLVLFALVFSRLGDVPIQTAVCIGLLAGVGVKMIWIGIQRHKTRLTVCEHGFEYQDRKGQLRATMYSDVAKMIPKWTNASPDSILVTLKNGQSFAMNYLSFRGCGKGLKDMKRLMSASPTAS